MKLGRSFASQIGRQLTEADLFLSGAGKLQLAEHKSKTRLPDNEPLILHGVVGKNRIGLKQDIYSIKRGNRLMISLGDFCTAADLPIAVRPKQGMAEGWFIREDQTFRLDLKKGEAVIAGQTVKVDPKDIEEDGYDILVSAEQLEKWFGLQFNYNFADLALLITSNQPLPAEDAYRRSKLHGQRKYTDSEVKQPFQETPYALLSQPYFDTNLSGSWARRPGSPPTRSGAWSTIASQDIAGFNAQAFAGGDGQKPYLDNLRVALGRQDADGNLLGKLHATSYQFGDISTVSQPLIGGGALEQGAIITNRPLETTTETSTDLRGNAQPGWDVELYRNDIFLDIRHIDITGLYEFKDIDLLIGDNDFKFLFHGPRGEVREEHRTIGVNPNELVRKKGYYAASISRNSILTWQPNPPTSPDAGTARFAGTYEYGFPSFGTVNVGLRTTQENGAYRTFAQTGIASYYFNTYFNANIGYDLDTLDTSEILTARHNFGQQAALLQYTRNSRGYNTSSATAGAGLLDSYRASLSGPFLNKFSFLNRLTYNLDSTYSNFYDDSTQTELASGLSTRLQSMILSGNASYRRHVDSGGVDSETATANVTGHGFLYGGAWWLEARYDVLPTFRLTENTLEYDHSIGENLDATTQIRYTPNPKLTTASASLNWRTGKATISPNLSVDSNHNVIAGVNMHFGLAADPYSHRYNMYNAYLSASGGVAARIFLDKNGDGIFNNDDELMPDVQIKALQTHRSAVSNERGIAFIPDLEENRLTDIIVDQATFKDSFDVSLFEGVSIRPHPGSVTQLDFPVVVSGEMDGQADYVDNANIRQPARNLQMTLTALDGHVEKTVTVAYDGYWSMSMIRPGIYYLNADTKMADEPVYMVPEKIAFTANGTTLYGHPTTLIRGYDIPFRFTSINKPERPRNRARVEKPGDIAREEVRLHLGPYHSRLALTFAWYKFKIRSHPFSNGFSLLKPLSDTAPDPKTARMELTLIPRQPLSLHEAANACRKLQDLKFDCAVEIVTHYAPVQEPTTEAARVSGKKG